MDYISTRDVNNAVSPLAGVLKGIAADGGLFVPRSFPALSIDDIESFGQLTYPELAAEILSKYIDMDKDSLLALTAEAYSSFDTEQTVPLRRLGDSEYILELWHGPTLAFKDMALQVLPRLMSEALSREDGKRILILTATSGDTGKAALEGFKDVQGTAIVVFYPSEGVSHMQKLQMTTQPGDNVYVCAVKGNFDDAQSAVKRLFVDEAFAAKIGEAGYSLSSANSINLGRLVPQIVYYVHAYASLAADGAIAAGDPINIVVPTGNFGNILAAYYAKRMGIPVNKLICASNSNNVLTDFFHTGDYSLDREFYKTMSPSMDILISSNLERLLFELCGRDGETVRDWMRSLSEEGEFAIEPELAELLSRDFYADFCDDAATSAAIMKTFTEHGYLLDTHTAVAQSVYESYVSATGDDTVTVLASTANPYKFPQDVYASVEGGHIEDAFAAAEDLCKVTAVRIPRQITELNELPVRFTEVAEKDALGDVVLRALQAFGSR